MKFYLGAYYLIQLQDSSVIDNERIYLYTPSTCINNSLLDGWSLSWVKTTTRDFKEASENFSVSSEEIKQIQSWTDQKFNEEKVLWLNVFSNLESLTEYKSFFKNLDEEKVKVLAIYFNQDDKEELIREFGSDDKTLSSFGLETMLSKQIEEDSTGQTIGYDLIGVEISGDFHSFHCHNLADELKEKFSVEINDFGLIKNVNNWKDLVSFMNDEDNGFAPVSWFFVKVNFFSINSLG